MTSRDAMQDLRKDALKHLDRHIKYLNERLDVIEKDLEVLELIKEKAVNVARLNYAVRMEEEDGLEYYNSFATIEDFDELTKKEFWLLKEWLEK